MKAQGKPPVTVIVLDTLRADFLSDPKLLERLPTLRRLMSESIVFTRAYTSSHWTLPAHATLFTGLAPSEHGARPPSMHLREDVPTIAEIFAAHGYRSRAVSCNPFISEPFGMARGFSGNELVEGRHAPPFVNPLLSRFDWDGRLARTLRDVHTAVIGLVQSSPRLDNGVGEAISLIRSEAGDPEGSTFLFANFMETHFPYRGRGPFSSWLRRLKYPRILGRYDELALETLSGRRPITEDEVNAAHEIYWQNAAFLDHQLDRLLGRLPGRCLEDGWLVILSDHGELLGEKGAVGHYTGLWEPLVHVPLLIRPPGGGPERRIANPVGIGRVFYLLSAIAHGEGEGLEDWLTSVSTVQAAFIEANAHMVPHVISLGRGAHRRDPLWRKDVMAFHATRNTPAVAVVTARWKLICRMGQGEDELYDLSVDNAEEKSMITQQPDVTRDLHELLRRRYSGAEIPASPAALASLRDLMPVEAKVSVSQAVLGEALKPGRNPAILWTAGKDSTLVLYLALSVAQRDALRVPPVVLVDHGQHFPETWTLVKEVVAREKLDLVIARNDDLLSVAKPGVDTVALEDLDAENQTEALRVGLEGTRVPLSLNTQVGNHMMKTVALNRTLRSRGFDTVITGIRWDENPARSAEVFFSPREEPPHTRVHPILPWTERDVWTYTLREKLPVHPLYAKGYRSLDGIHDSSPTDTRPAWEQDLEGTKERAGRAQDKEHIMERLRALGYF